MAHRDRLADLPHHSRLNLLVKCNTGGQSPSSCAAVRGIRATSGGVRAVSARTTIRVTSNAWARPSRMSALSSEVPDRCCVFAADWFESESLVPLGEVV